MILIIILFLQETMSVGHLVERSETIFKTNNLMLMNKITKFYWRVDQHQVAFLQSKSRNLQVKTRCIFTR